MKRIIAILLTAVLTFSIVPVADAQSTYDATHMLIIGNNGKTYAKLLLDNNVAYISADKLSEISPLYDGMVTGGGYEFYDNLSTSRVVIAGGKAEVYSYWNKQHGHKLGEFPLHTLEEDGVLYVPLGQTARLLGARTEYLPDDECIIFQSEIHSINKLMADSSVDYAFDPADVMKSKGWASASSAVADFLADILDLNLGFYDEHFEAACVSLMTFNDNDALLMAEAAAVKRPIINAFAEALATDKDNPVLPVAKTMKALEEVVTLGAVTNNHVINYIELPEEINLFSDAKDNIKHLSDAFEIVQFAQCWADCNVLLVDRMERIAKPHFVLQKGTLYKYIEMARGDAYLTGDGTAWKAMRLVIGEGLSGIAKLSGATLGMAIWDLYKFSHGDDLEVISRYRDLVNVERFQKLGVKTYSAARAKIDGGAYSKEDMFELYDAFLFLARAGTIMRQGMIDMDVINIGNADAAKVDEINMRIEFLRNQISTSNILVGKCLQVNFEMQFPPDNLDDYALRGLPILEELSQEDAYWLTLNVKPMVSAGGKHTVGLRSNGMVLATGDDSYGQCSEVFFWEDIVKISAGGTHTVGLKSDGTVVAAGNNRQNQCNVGNWKNIVHIYAGQNATMAIDTNGRVYSTDTISNGIFRALKDHYVSGCVSMDAFFGITERDELSGYYIGGNADTPRFRIPGSIEAVQVDTNQFDSFALGSDGRIYTDAMHTYLHTDDWDNWTDIVKIAVGGDADTIIFAQDSTGKLYSSGPYLSLALAWTDIMDFSIGTNHAVGVRSDGSVVACGEISSGQCNVGKWNLLEPDIWSAQGMYALGPGVYNISGNNQTQIWIQPDNIFAIQPVTMTVQYQHAQWGLLSYDCEGVYARTGNQVEITFSDMNVLYCEVTIKAELIADNTLRIISDEGYVNPMQGDVYKG